MWLTTHKQLPKNKYIDLKILKKKIAYWGCYKASLIVVGETKYKKREDEVGEGLYTIFLGWWERELRGTIHHTGLECILFFLSSPVLQSS